ncbi:hypothetical protein O0L34_g16059 [Tuta absoluta]|nr:hypothetical protein O0L34_g16059 [Tuta absoluta]
MLYQAIFLTIITAATSHTPANTSSIIMVGGHADMQDTVFLTTKPAGVTGVTTRKTTANSDSSDELTQDEHHGKKKEEEGDVVFVPTGRNIFMNDEALHEDTIRMSDVLDNKRVSGVKETEKPGDILFIQGKNNERQSRPNVETRRMSNVNEENKGEFKYIDYEDEETKKGTTPVPLDCEHLDCEHVIDSVCGGKMERSEMKYRLFKNECFFRKVNCGFNYATNRYLQVDLDFCKNIATHVTRQYDNYPMYYQKIETQQIRPQKRRNDIEPTRRFSGRRAMIMNEGGKYCSHACPTMCTDVYEPECALSASGLRRVFRNHCSLDLNSCEYQMLWRVRPLSECTGVMKADMHQNRAFIDWMQKSGIIDRKGKLVLN